MSNSSKNISYLGWVSAFSDMASAMVMPILPLYIVVVLGEGIDKLGLAMAITTLVSYALRFFGGWLSDRLNQNKPFLLVGYGLSALAKPLLVFAGGWLGVVALRSAERLGKAIRSAPRDKLIALSSDNQKAGRGFGKHKAIEKAGEFFGLALLLLLFASLGESEKSFSLVFALSAIPGVLAMLVLLLKVEERQAKKLKANLSAFKFRPETTLVSPVSLFLLASSCMFGEALYTVYAHQLGWSITSLITLLAATKLLQFTLSFQSGKWCDCLPASLLLSIAYLMAMLALALLFLESSWALVLSLALFALFETLAMTAIRVLVANKAQDKGASFGFLYLGMSISGAAGSFMLTWFWESFGIAVALSAGLLGVVCALVMQSIALLRGRLRVHSSGEDCAS